MCIPSNSVRLPHSPSVHIQIPAKYSTIMSCVSLQLALLCGPPGLGKTTLAHIIARHAGYNVVEMNARLGLECGARGVV